MVTNITVIGLGYVGLPLAIALAQFFTTTGFDINENRIKQLKKGLDQTGEIEDSILNKTTLKLSSDLSDIKDQDLYIITVPTPVTKNNKPDLQILEKASEFVGKSLKKNSVIVYESTVYPGVTENFCGPILEKISGLKSGVDFFLGYSPERINPGDKKHTIDQITKVVSGQNPQVSNLLKEIYGKINKNNIFIAKDIKTAEAAKVIENAQRDINIAFINEISIIMKKLELSIYDVLEAAQTKWNFLDFKPGLVGGHCIGVDPYYLAECSRNLGHEPEVILAGRRINESMGNAIALSICDEITKTGTTSSANILVLGLTFKENIPDLRNTKVLDVINTLKLANHKVDVHDPFASSNEAWDLYKIRLLPSLENIGNYDCIIGAVSHKPYLGLTSEKLLQLLKPRGLIADIKNIWKNVKLPNEIDYWSL